MRITPKSNKQYRFCIDFRNLDLVTKVLVVWSTPVIQKTTIERMESKRPKYNITIMNLTKGCYQAHLTESSRHFTAFITLMGLYEWICVPMGLQCTPAHFQRFTTIMVITMMIYIS